MTGAGYTCGEQSTEYKRVESPCCTPEINVTWCLVQLYFSLFLGKKKRMVASNLRQAGQVFSRIVFFIYLYILSPQPNYQLPERRDFRSSCAYVRRMGGVGVVEKGGK